MITLFILLFRKENIFTDYIICTFAHFRQHEPPSTEVVPKELLLQLGYINDNISRIKDSFMVF